MATRIEQVPSVDGVIGWMDEGAGSGIKFAVAILVNNDGDVFVSTSGSDPGLVCNALYDAAEAMQQPDSDSHPTYDPRDEPEDREPGERDGTDSEDGETP